MYTIVAPQKFLRQARKFFKRHPDLKPRFAEVIGALQKNPFHPHLELHPLTGKMEGGYAVSLTYRYRITLTLMLTDKEIILLDIGSYDQVSR